MRWIRNLPILRNRSNTEFGGLLALFAVLGFAVLFSVTMTRYASNPPSPLLSGLAGVGGTLLVAYSVVATNLVAAIRRRGRDREIALGFLVGLALCGAIGIGLALLLLEAAQPLDWIHRLGFCWSVTALVFLAALIAVAPIFAYDELRDKHVNNDDD